MNVEIMKLGCCRSLMLAVVAMLINAPSFGQPPNSISNGGKLIGDNDLPPFLASSHRVMGARMTTCP